MPNAKLCLVITMMAFASTSAHALKSDRDQPLDVRARYQESVLGQRSGGDTNIATLKGDVVMTQGSLKATGDVAVVYDTDKAGKGGDGSVRRLKLTGNPARMEQQLDNDGGLMQASANTIEYSTGSSTAELTGNVIVIQKDKSEFRGERMTYNTASGAMQSGSEQGNGEVRLRFLPQPKKTGGN